MLLGIFPPSQRNMWLRTRQGYVSTKVDFSKPGSYPLVADFIMPEIEPFEKLEDVSLTTSSETRIIVNPSENLTLNPKPTPEILNPTTFKQPRLRFTFKDKKTATLQTKKAKVEKVNKKKKPQLKPNDLKKIYNTRSRTALQQQELLLK